MTPLEWAVVAILVALAMIATATIAARSRSAFRNANDVVPGVRSPAPASWAGSHTPEARLHRRLRDAVTSVRLAAPDGADSPFRATIEREALAIDERLVAVAALAERVRAEPLAQVTQAVDALEDAVATLVTTMDRGGQVVPRALADVTEHLQLLHEARVEVDELSALPPSPEAGGTSQGPP